MRVPPKTTDIIEWAKTTTTAIDRSHLLPPLVTVTRLDNWVMVMPSAAVFIREIPGVRQYSFNKLTARTQNAKDLFTMFGLWTQQSDGHWGQVILVWRKTREASHTLCQTHFLWKPRMSATIAPALLSMFPLPLLGINKVIHKHSPPVRSILLSCFPPI